MFDNPDAFELTPPPPIEELVALGDTGEFFATFIDFLQSNLIKRGIEAEEASRIVTAVTCELSKAFAGETFYVTNKPTIFARQLAMYQDLKRMPHKEVDRKYGVSVGYSLQVKKQIEDKRFRRNQLKLFD